MKRILKHFSLCSLLLGIGIMGGLLLLYLVFCIPTKVMKSHVGSSLPMLEKEFADDMQIEGYEGTLRGGFTDDLMLLTAIYDEGDHSRLERSLLAYRYESGQGTGWAPGYSLAAYLGEGGKGREVTYSRYWHGYLVVLKPLLAWTTPAALRLWSSLVQYLLLGLFLWICEKKKVFHLGMALCGTVLFLYVPFLYSSISLSICFYVTLIAACIQVRSNHTLIQKERYVEFFLLIGMVTAYLDLLTYPLLCLGIPLTIYTYLNREVLVKKLVALSAVWFLGYLGMWMGKWLLAQIFTHENVLMDAFLTVRKRTDGGSDLIWWKDWLHVMEVNTRPYRNQPFLVLVILGIVALLCLIWLRRPSFKMAVSRALPFAAIAMLPVLWYGMARNHSEEHWMFTSKIWVVSIFACVVFCIRMMEREKPLNVSCEDFQPEQG